MNQKADMRQRAAEYARGINKTLIEAGAAAEVANSAEGIEGLDAYLAEVRDLVIKVQAETMLARALLKAAGK